MSITVQKRNAELVSLLSSDFQPLRDSVFAASKTSGFITQLDGLQGYWPGGTTDVSGIGNSLTDNNPGSIDNGWVNATRYAQYSGSGHATASGSIANGSSGISGGGWWRQDNLLNRSPNDNHLMNRSNGTVTTASSWSLFQLEGLTYFVFEVINANTSYQVLSANLISDYEYYFGGKWVYVGFTYKPSEYSMLCLGYEKGFVSYKNESVPSSINAGTANFQIGRMGSEFSEISRAMTWLAKLGDMDEQHHYMIYASSYHNFY
jgi:hypothetical protein